MTRAQRERLERLQVRAEKLRGTLAELATCAGQARCSASKSLEAAAVLDASTSSLREENRALNGLLRRASRHPFLSDGLLWVLAVVFSLGVYGLFSGHLLALVALLGAVAMVVSVLVLAVAVGARS